MKKQPEYQLCVSFWRWCCYHREIAKYMFAIEHGGIRSAFIGAKLKTKGVKAGMADYVYIKPNSKYNNLWLEFKTGSNKQTLAQQDFQQIVEDAGGKYIVCRDLMMTIDEIAIYDSTR